jgi:hypothetical protein
MDQDRHESLDRYVDELLSGLLAPLLPPLCDLGGAHRVGAPLVTGQLGCHLGHRPGSDPLGLVVRRAVIAEVL